jgi:hypothetical protein
MTATTVLKVPAARRNAMSRRFQNAIQATPSESRLLLEQGRFNFFALKHKRHKHSLAAPILVCGQARQPITAVN